MASRIHELLKTRKILVCVGAGGVGKTTVSAALGVAAAAVGRRTLVLTVDPARRLANALGLESIAEHVQQIGIAAFAAEGCSVLAPLDAAMLDVKGTFDRVVARHAPTQEVRERILRHPFYQQASTALAGSQEYMAMERLYEAVTSGDYDLVVLDTPPSEHALEFLDAPSRLVDLFDSAAFRMLVSRGGARARPGLLRTGSVVMRGLSRFTSIEMFGNLLEFFGQLAHTFDGFVDRARNIQALLHGPDAAFVLVSGCDAASTGQAHSLGQHLARQDYHIGAVVMNRVAPFAIGPHVAQSAAVDESARLVGEVVGRAPEPHDLRTARTWADVAGRLGCMAHMDAEVVQAMRTSFPGNSDIVAVPRTELEPDTLARLYRIAQTLEFATDAASAAG